MKLSKTKVPGVFILSGVASVEQHGDILLVRDGAKASEGIKRGRAKGSGRRGRPKGSKNKPKGSKNKPKAAKAAPKKRSKTVTAVKTPAKKQPASPAPAQTA